jgi:hypothetical protein
VLALALAAFCFLQLVVRKTSTEAALSTVTAYLRQAQLGPEELARVERALDTIRWNDRTALQARFMLWLAGCLGFSLLAVANLFLAYRIDRTIFGGEAPG